MSITGKHETHIPHLLWKLLLAAKQRGQSLVGTGFGSPTSTTLKLQKLCSRHTHRHGTLNTYITMNWPTKFVTVKFDVCVGQLLKRYRTDSGNVRVEIHILLWFVFTFFSTFLFLFSIFLFPFPFPFSFFQDQEFVSKYLQKTS